MDTRGHRCDQYIVAIASYVFIYMIYYVCVFFTLLELQMYSTSLHVACR